MNPPHDVTRLDLLYQSVMRRPLPFVRQALRGREVRWNDAWDYLHEAFRRFAEAIESGRYEDRGTANAFLKVLIRRAASDAARNNSHANTSYDGEGSLGSQLPTRPEDGPEAQVIRKEDAARLAEAFDRLPLRDRYALTRSLDEKSLTGAERKLFREETLDELGVTDLAYRQLLSRALRKIRILLTEVEEDVGVAEKAPG